MTKIRTRYLYINVLGMCAVTLTMPSHLHVLYMGRVWWQYWPTIYACPVYVRGRGERSQLTARQRNRPCQNLTQDLPNTKQNADRVQL